ncbi:hypothetical protein CPB85DRAFT_1557102 [Mucidula mucida]|nr:hypothetical protein CPB85DRAFT_1557102 [Mucidula mucida]
MGQELYSIQIAKKEEAARRAKQRAALLGRREPSGIQRSDDQPQSLDSFRRGGSRARQTNVLPMSRAAIHLRDSPPIRRALPVYESELGSEMDSDDYGTEIDWDDYVEVDEDEFIEIDEDELFQWEAIDEDSQSEYESEGLIEEAQHVMVRRSPVVFRGQESADQENDLREPDTRR